MQANSSSAVRADQSPMFGSMGFPGGGRTLKKKPVLMLAPEELAKAHHLFQLGAAEQIGEFDPMRRTAQVTPLFGTPTAVPAPAMFGDEDDDYQPLFTLAEEDEEPEEDLPPIDLAAILALTPAEQEEEDAFFAAEPDFVEELEPEADLEAEPELEAETAEEPLADESETALAPQPAEAELSPADALSRVLGRAASQAKPADEPLDNDWQTDMTEAPLDAETFAREAEWLEAEPYDLFEEEQLELEEELEAEQEPLDLLDHVDPEDDANFLPELQLIVVPVFETGPRSELRARLVREDLTLARPEPSLWRKVMIALRRLRWGGAAD